MKKTVNRLFQLRQALDECEKEFGLGGYSEVERAVFFILPLMLMLRLPQLKMTRTSQNILYPLSKEQFSF